MLFMACIYHYWMIKDMLLKIDFLLISKSKHAT